jgi:hypothetical protein
MWLEGGHGEAKKWNSVGFDFELVRSRPKFMEVFGLVRCIRKTAVS